MALNTYEFMLIFDPNRVASDLPGSVGQINAVLERNQAEILASRQWDERRLAYPIKNHKKGLYYLTYFRTEGKNIANLERDFSLNEMILRALILNIDPKLVDVMLQLARDEHAVALQTVTEPPPEDEHGDEERGPRRGPRGGGGRDSRPVEDKDA